MIAVSEFSAKVSRELVFQRSDLVVSHSNLLQMRFSGRLKICVLITDGGKPQLLPQGFQKTVGIPLILVCSLLESVIIVKGEHIIRRDFIGIRTH